MNLPISDEIHEAPRRAITMRPTVVGPARGISSCSKRHLDGTGTGASRNRIDPGLRLLADLLAQVVRIAALGRRDGVPFDLTGSRFMGAPSKVIRRMPAAVASASSPSSITSARRVCSKSRGYPRRRTSRRHRDRGRAASQFSRQRAARLSLGQHDIENEPRSSRTTARTASVRARAAFELLFDQMGNEFGIGFGTELVVALEQVGAQVEVILDDAVVDDGDGAGLVRVGVALGGTAVRGPSRMADADATGNRRLSIRWRRLLSLPTARRISMLPDAVSVAMPAES